MPDAAQGGQRQHVAPRGLENRAAHGPAAQVGLHGRVCEAAAGEPHAGQGAVCCTATHVNSCTLHFGCLSQPDCSLLQSSLHQKLQTARWLLDTSRAQSAAQQPPSTAARCSLAAGHDQAHLRCTLLCTRRAPPELQSLPVRARERTPLARGCPVAALHSAAGPQMAPHGACSNESCASQPAHAGIRLLALAEGLSTEKCAMSDADCLPSA